MKKLHILFLIIVFTACGTTKLILVTPSQSDVDRVSSKYPGYSLTDLNQGKALFEQTCSRCHHLKDPASRNEEKWKGIVPTMVGRLNKKEGKEVIDSAQQESILRYLVTMSSASKPAK